MEAKNHKVFYGWWIVAAGFFIAVYIGGFIHFGVTAVFEPIASDFGWSYTQISFAASLRGLQTSFLAPVVGLLMDRWGPRRLVFAGATFIGLGLLLLSRINSLGAFYGAFFLITIGISTCIGVVPIATVGNWFHRKATLATGIIVSGAATGGLMVPLATRVIDIFEWRTAMAILGFVAWGILLPLSLLFRHKPEQYGYSPDGDLNRRLPPSEGQSSAQDNELDIGVKQILKSSAFWHIAMGFMCHILVMNAVVTHVMPYLSSIGFTRSFSSLMASAIPATSIVGRLGFGWLGDKFDKRRIAALGFVLTSLGLLSFGYVATGGAWMLVPSLVIIGLGYGGPVPMMPALVREYFGRVRLATILGLVMGVAALGGMVGPPLAGLAFDRLGSYQVAWFGLGGLIIAGMVSLLTTPQLTVKYESVNTNIENTRSSR
jgi:OFA family oxalate/formate antiporter-like MFS transporter